MCSAKRHVRFTPNSGHVRCKSKCPLCAKSGHSCFIRSSGQRAAALAVSAAGNHHLERVRAGSADELWAKYIGSLPAGRDLRRQDSPWSGVRSSVRETASSSAKPTCDDTCPSTPTRMPATSSVSGRTSYVRFTPKSGHWQRTSPCPLCANSGHRAYSITSSARESMDGGTVRPSALAVFRLSTSSFLVGACTGRSAGFSPLRMRST